MCPAAFTENTTRAVSLLNRAAKNYNGIKEIRPPLPPE
eukprot:gene5038-10092_t